MSVLGVEQTGRLEEPRQRRGIGFFTSPNIPSQASRSRIPCPRCLPVSCLRVLPEALSETRRESPGLTTDERAGIPPEKDKDSEKDKERIKG